MANDRIIKARTELTRRAAKLEADLVETRQQLKRLDDAENLILSLGISPDVREEQREFSAVNGGEIDLKDIGLTEAVRRVVDTRGKVAPLYPVQIRDEILKGGFSPIPKSLSPSVSVALRRLVVGKKIESIENQDGRRAYAARGFMFTGKRFPRGPVESQPKNGEAT